MDLLRWLFDSDRAYWRWSDSVTEHPAYRWGPVVLCAVVVAITTALGNYEHAALFATIGLVGWYVTRD